MSTNSVERSAARSRHHEKTSARFLDRGVAVLLPLVICLLTPEAGKSQSVDAYLSADSVRVGDRFFLTLKVRHGSEADPLFPEIDAGREMFGDLEVLTVRQAGTGFVDDGATGGRIDSLTYEVTTFALDTAFVPSIPVYFVVDGDTSFYASAPLELSVISIVPETAENIRDLAPIVEFPRNVWPWIIGLLLLAGLVTGLIVYLSRRTPPQKGEPPSPPAAPSIPPYEEAVQRFKKLEKTSNLNDLHQIKPYYVQLTEILRVYLGRRLRISAMESTSEEVMQEINKLAHHTDLPDEAAYLVRRVLHVSDLVKFADLRPRPEIGHQALAESRKVLDVVESGFKKAELRRLATSQASTETPTAVNNIQHAHDE